MRRMFLVFAAVGLSASALLVGAAQSGRNRTQQVPEREEPSLTTSDVGVASSDRPSDRPSVALPAARSDAEAKPIAWQRNFYSAKKGAKSGQLIVVDVYTDWCGWCKVMDREIYSNPDVMAFAADNVFVKVNAEDRGDGTRFAREMGVQGFPATFVFTNDGQLLGSQTGAIRRPEEFLGWLASAKQN